MRTESYSPLETYHAAHELHELGYHLVPCAYGGKTPLIKWKDADCSHELIDQWFDLEQGFLNFAIHVGKSGIVGLDADTEAAGAWIGEHCPMSDMFATTPSGGLHVYFKAPENPPKIAVNVLGIGLDVRSRASLLIASPSWCREHERRWRWAGLVLPPAELPELPPGLLPERCEPKRDGSPPPSVHRGVGEIRDVTRWIMAVPSVQGQHGSSGCYKVACRLVDAGFGWEEAMLWLRTWNARVPQPPWSERELEHKLRSAFNR
jgi:hypothetical protein